MHLRCCKEANWRNASQAVQQIGIGDCPWTTLKLNAVGLREADEKRGHLT